MARGRVTALAIVVVGLALPATAGAHDPSAALLGGGGADGVPEAVEDALGGKVTALEDGLYKVRSKDGSTITTHGPDFRQDLELPLHGGSIDIGDPQRTPACVADAATGYYQEVLYGYPASGTNDLAAKRADIQGVMARIDAVLNEESLASGGPTADYVLRCNGDGSVRVTAFPVTASGSVTFTQVVNAAKAAGFVNPRADYSIFYDGAGPSGTCGTAGMYDDETLAASNKNNNPGGLTPSGYAVSYGGCWFGRTPMHENGHNMGAVQAGAPDSTGDGGHCDEGSDVMCYLDGGSLRQDYPQACSINPSELHYDCGWDSYFDAAPEAGEYLATHWNVGSTLNRFIRFGGPSPDFDVDCVLVTCTFTDRSSATAGIASRSWTFSDGTTSSAANPVHVFPAVGGYTVTLTVTDGSGQASSTTRSVALNDGFANAEVLDGASETVTGGTTGATKEAGEPNHADNSGGASVWYRWTPAGTGPVAIDTCASGYDTTLGVYTGSAVDSLTRVAANDDNPGACGSGTSKSSVTFNAHAGTTYRIAVDGWDGATGPISLHLAQTVDSTAPAVTIGSGPSGTTGDPSATFAFTASVAAGFVGRLDDEAFAGCGSPQAYAGLADGPHTFSVRATEGAGNAGTADRAFTVDTTAPETTFDSGPRRVKQGHAAVFTFSSSEPGSTFRCRLDSGNFSACTSPGTVRRPRPGVHTVQVVAVDALGHADRTPATRSFKVKKRRRR
jgi:PKD repeat protein